MLHLGAEWRQNILGMPLTCTIAQSTLVGWRERAFANRLPFILVRLLITSSLYGSCFCLVSGHIAVEPEELGSVSLLSENENFIFASSRQRQRGEVSSSISGLWYNLYTPIHEPQDKENTIDDARKKVEDESIVFFGADRTQDALHLQKGTLAAAGDFNERLDTRTPTVDSTLAVFTNEGCPYSEEALREAQLAQKMVRSLGSSLTVVNVKETELAKLLGIKTIPCLRFYLSPNIRSAAYKTYDGANIAADEIAHWILLHQGKTVQSAASFRTASSRGSPVGPVVHAFVHEGSQRAALVVRLSKNTEQLPSRFTLFYIEHVDSSEREEFRVYRKKLPFDVGEEEYLTLEEPQWEPKSILALLLEAENRMLFYGDRPSRVLLGKRALLTVYVSHLENLQDIAWLLMEFYETYRDRIAFHIAKNTLKEAARSRDTFSHSWGGAVIADKRANASAYQKVAGVMREHSPFTQYSLSMPFNYHSLQVFLKEWSTGNAELHFRSNRLTYTDKGSHVMELNHVQFLNVLQKARRVPLGILYYEPECSDCQVYLRTWKEVAEVFSTTDALKDQVLFGQVDGHLNDIIDFDMKQNIPSIAVYPEGPQALEKRILYTGPPIVNILAEFLGTVTGKREEL